MATITQSFTYALPVENYVAGISTTKTATYTYVGPDEFDVEIDGEGYIINFDLTEYPSPDRKKTIKATEAAKIQVTTPTKVIKLNVKSANSNNGEHLATRNTPAVTIVAA